MDELWIGVDIGTTAVKAAAYGADGRMRFHAERPNEVLRPAPGHAEQDMEAVWARVAACLGDLTRQCADAGGRIAALGLCGQGDGFWAVDEAGRPVGPAMLWSDTRASADIEALTTSGAADAVGLGCHTAIWAGTSGPLWRWLRRARPEQAARVAHVATSADWIGLCLTGTMATDRSNGSIPFTDFATGGYGAALSALDCDDLRPRLLPPRRAGERLGTVTAEAARRTGLPAGLPVSVATLDLAAMILGMGLARPGEANLIMGTTAVVNILTDHVEPQARPIAASVLHPSEPVVIRVLAPTTGAAALDWFAALTGTAGDDGPRGAEVAALGALVESSPPGAGGVTFLPYLNGERAPFVMSDLAASFHGLTQGTRRADLARAVMEGTALSLRHCCAAEGGLRGDGAVQLTGGGSRSPVWCQIIADVLGRTVETNPAFDQGLWGAACLGAEAAGKGRALVLVARDEERRAWHPDPARVRAYDAVWRRYDILSRAMRRAQEELRQAQTAPPEGE